MRLPLEKTAWRFAVGAAALLLAAFWMWQSSVALRAVDSRNEPTYWREVGAQLPNDGKIVALTQDYGFPLMYYGWRKVLLWPNRAEKKLSELRGNEKEFDRYFTKHTEGKSYFLITAFKQYEDQPDLQAKLTSNYPVIAEGNGYLLFDLRQAPAP
jgi:hypothetical protein